MSVGDGTKKFGRLDTRSWRPQGQNCDLKSGFYLFLVSEVIALPRTKETIEKYFRMTAAAKASP